MATTPADSAAASGDIIKRVSTAKFIEGTDIPKAPPGGKIIDKIREVQSAGGTTVSFEFFPAKVSEDSTALVHDGG
jgi:hypothetical protein